MAKLPLLGILGGMGPLATADFYRIMVERTPAGEEAEHLPTLILSDPTIPGRPRALATGELKPVEDALVERLQMLASAGAKLAVMPCNTAHFWWDALEARVDLPMISIVDAGVAALQQTGAKRVAVLGTRPTMERGLYDAALKAAGIMPVRLDETETGELLRAIALVKENAFEDAAVAFQSVVEPVSERSDSLLIACTELPLILGRVALPGSRIVDATVALADTAIAWAYDQAQKDGTHG